MKTLLIFALSLATVIAAAESESKSSAEPTTWQVAEEFCMNRDSTLKGELLKKCIKDQMKSKQSTERKTESETEEMTEKVEKDKVY